MKRLLNFRPPTNEQLQLLYEAADRYRQIAPWQFIRDRPLVAVENPSGGDVAYCVVVGDDGDVPGLQIFLGKEGLQSWQRMHDLDRSPEPDLSDPVEVLRIHEQLDSCTFIAVDLEVSELSGHGEKQKEERIGKEIKGMPRWLDLYRFVSIGEVRPLTSDEVDFTSLLLDHMNTIAEEIEEDPQGVLGDAPEDTLLWLSPVVDPQTREVSWGRDWRRAELPLRLGFPAQATSLIDPFSLPDRENLIDEDTIDEDTARDILLMCAYLPLIDSDLHVMVSDRTYEIRLPHSATPQSQRVLALINPFEGRCVAFTPLSNGEESDAMRFAVAALCKQLGLLPRRLGSELTSMEPVLRPMCDLLEIGYATMITTPEIDLDMQNEIARAVVDSGIADASPTSRRREKEILGIQGVEWEPYLQPIADLLFEFCAERMKPTFEVWCRGLIDELDESAENSPLRRGRPEIWACAIAYTIASQNDLWYASGQMGITTDELCDFFGVKKTTAAQKYQKIREILDIPPQEGGWFAG